MNQVRRVTHLMILGACTTIMIGSYWLLTGQFRFDFESSPYFLDLESFLYPIPSSVSRLSIVFLLLSSIITARFCILPHSIERTAFFRDTLSSPRWTSSGIKGVIFQIAIALYLGFLGHLALIGTSLYSLIPFALSLLGIFYSLRTPLSGAPYRGPLSLERLDWILIACLTAASLCLSTYDNLSWYFSAIGDELEFYTMAQEVLRTPWLNPFDYSWAYGKFPMGDSLYTALYLWVFGTSVTAWKLSCGGAHVITTVLVFLLGRVLWNRSAGALSAFIVMSSHYFLAFDRIGYNNTNMNVTSCLIMLVFLVGYQTGSRAILFVAGCASGLATYSIWSGLIIVPTIGIIAVVLAAQYRRWQQLYHSSMTLGFGFLLAALPGMLTNPLHDVQRIFLDLNHGVSPLSDPSADHWSALLRSALAWFHNEWWGSHYVFGPLLDPISALLFLVGFWSLSVRPRRWQSVVLLVWIVPAFVMIVMGSRMSSPYITRLLFLLPPLALVSGWALSQALTPIRWQTFRNGTAALTCMAILCLNLQQLYVGTPLASPVYETRLAIREVQNSRLPTITYVSPGAHEDTNTLFLLRLYAPTEVTVYSVTEQQVRDILNGSSPLNGLSAEGKFIAPSRLEGLLRELYTAGIIRGPVTLTAPLSYGDQVTVANETPPTDTASIPRWLPSAFRDFMGVP